MEELLQEMKDEGGLYIQEPGKATAEQEGGGGKKKKKKKKKKKEADTKDEFDWDDVSTSL